MIGSIRASFYRAALTALVLSGLVATVVPGARAEVLERVARDGVLRAGTRADAAPFAMLGPDGTFSGLSVDLLEAIRSRAEARLGRPVRLDLSDVTPADRLDRVASGALDIVCGITTPTRAREEIVDFSLPFFRDGTRVLVYRDTLEAGRPLSALTIAVAESTTTQVVIAEALPGATISLFPDMRAAMDALEAGEVEGVANLGVVLLGVVRERQPQRSVVLLPRTSALNTEPMACVLPEDDSAWRDLVNSVLVDLFDGIREFRGDYVTLHERWFGPDSLMHYPLDRETRDYLDAVRPWAD
jgi:polar amino acid transport system substrate-binding protein